ncbi:TetR/AcrR family transcriptional regulator [soil metagenome]
MPAPRKGSDSARTARERIIDAAGRLISTDGWRSVTMGKVASAAGVSRQTVYNEAGNKAGLAALMVDHELSKAMRLVNEAFDAAPDNITEAVRGSVARVLRRASVSPLLTAIATASAGADSAFLPLLTTHGQVLLDSAKLVIRIRVAEHNLAMDADLLETMIDSIVRLVISHMVQRTMTPEQVADNLASIVRHVVASQQV